tara:strand:- start:80 stop:298 length:219 start_codon:yes stop_codon:yes gene_type:complete
MSSLDRLPPHVCSEVHSGIILANELEARANRLGARGGRLAATGTELKRPQGTDTEILLLGSSMQSPAGVVEV